MNQFPKAALAQHIAVLGKTGSGKSYAVRGIVEGLLDEGARVCIVDPTGAWSGLRSSVTGKSAGYPVVIFGGSHADLPLGGTHGEAIAEIIGTSSTPAIIDTSLMRVGERTRFFADFADALVRKNKGPLHLVIDEAHLFAPQGKVNDPQSGAMLHTANNLVSLGRSRGLRIILITQRPAKLHKDSLTQVETLVAMRLIAPQDRKAVEEWIKDNADEKKGKEIIESLATLKTGQGWVWAPELGILERMAFPKIKTFDSGRAPDGSEVAGQVLAPINREVIAEKLKQVGADALANDPAALKRKIAELERQAKAPNQTVVAAVGEDKLNEAYQVGFWEGKAAGWKGCADLARPYLTGLIERHKGAIGQVEHIAKLLLSTPNFKSSASSHVPPPRGDIHPMIDRATQMAFIRALSIKAFGDFVEKETRERIRVAILKRHLENTDFALHDQQMETYSQAFERCYSRKLEMRMQRDA